MNGFVILLSLNFKKDSKKSFGTTEKFTYTPLYITGAVLAALVAIGANDVYRSFTEKPNEFLKR